MNQVIVLHYHYTHVMVHDDVRFSFMMFQRYDKLYMYIYF